MSVIERGDPTMQIGDMMVIGQPDPELTKALAVIADELHPAYVAEPEIKLGISYRSCVLCSLTVRDFLRAVGFPLAHVATVFCVMRAYRGPAELHSVGIGAPDNLRRLDGDWNGHMVVIEPGARFLIDTTLYPSKRPQWDFLPGMMALPLLPPGRRALGFDIVTGYELRDGIDPDYRFEIAWLNRFGDRSWRKGGDGRDRARREPVVAKLVERFSRCEG